MRRREFITLLAGALTYTGLTAGAQQSQKLRRIGILNPESASLVPLPAFLDELRLLGWRDQENVLLDIRPQTGDTSWLQA